MSVSIMEALINADHNLQSGPILTHHPQVWMAKEQVHNAITLLQKGYDLSDQIDPLLEEYGDVEKIPEKESKEFGSIS